MFKLLLFYLILNERIKNQLSCTISVNFTLFEVKGHFHYHTLNKSFVSFFAISYTFIFKVILKLNSKNEPD